MAVDKRYLDPTGSGSKGTGGVGIYMHPTDNKAAIQGAGYFNPIAAEMRLLNSVRIIASDATFDAKVAVSSANVVTLSALDAF